MNLFSVRKLNQIYPSRLFANKSEGKYQVKLVLTEASSKCKLYFSRKSLLSGAGKILVKTFFNDDIRGFPF